MEDEHAVERANADVANGHVLGGDVAKESVVNLNIEMRIVRGHEIVLVHEQRTVIVTTRSSVPWQ
jgi:hypothetical protein